MDHQPPPTEAGVRPFNNDKTRGKWESPNDFLFACVGHAFKIDIIIYLPLLIFAGYGVYAVILYIAVLTLSIVPIISLQSFLGQFSSSGFISVFRVSPLFKGLGYVSLVLNFFTLINYGVFGSIPLLYFLHSLRPTLPWSCNGAGEWMDNKTTICNGKDKVPSAEFFRYQLNLEDYAPTDQMIYSIQLMLCLWIIYLVVTYIVLQPTEIIGRMMRYSFMVFVGLMSLCLLRFIFLPEAPKRFMEFLVPGAVGDGVPVGHGPYLLTIPFLALSTLGPGWGTVLTMASFNDFKTNVFRYSWLISLVHLGVVVGMGLLIIFLKSAMDPYNSEVTLKEFPEWITILKLPNVLTTLELPNLWSLLFFGMLSLGSLNLLVIQLLSFLTSLYDEFECLRILKKFVNIIIVGLIVVISSYSCSNFGIFICEISAKLNIIGQVVLNVLMLLLLIFVYDDFPRDLDFMTEQNITNCKWCIMLSSLPLILAYDFFAALMWVYITVLITNLSPHIFLNINLALLVLFCFILIWFLAPIGCIFEVHSRQGGLWSRLKMTIQPTNWHPVEPDNKHVYEELLRQEQDAPQNLNVSREDYV